MRGRIEKNLLCLKPPKILVYFLLFGIIGWFFETTYVWLRFGRFTYRGYFFAQHPLEYYITTLRNIPFISKIPVVLGMPFIEMYGLGGIIVVALFGHLEDRPVTLFMKSAVVMTLFELAGSYLCTEILHSQYWNYSKDFMNFDGRIALLPSLAWGALSVIGICLIKPRIDKLFSRIQGKRYLNASITALVTFIAFCAMYKYLIAPLISV